MAASRYKSHWSTLTPLGDRIEVVERGALLQLRVNGVWQGELDRSNPCLLPTPYMQHMLLALCFSGALRRFLVIGLGTGCIPKALHYLLPRARIDVVEIDPSIVKIAKRFFEVPVVKESDAHKPGIRIHVADGTEFLRRPPVTYDVIFVDAFTGGELPADLRSRRAMWDIRRALAPGGVLAFNLSRLDFFAVNDVQRHITELIAPPVLFDPKNAERHDDLNLVLLAPTPHNSRRMRERRLLLEDHREALGIEVEAYLQNTLKPSAIANLTDVLLSSFFESRRRI